MKVPTLVHQILPEEDGMLLRALLRGPLGLSAGVVRRAKRLERGITLDGAPVFVNVTVRQGQQLRVLLDDGSSSPGVPPTPGAIDLRYEDEHLFVLCKPAGLCVHPSPGHPSDSLGNLLRYYCDQRGLACTLRPVNRLDRGTSGLLVLARHPQVQTALTAQMRAGTFHRIYYALTLAAPQPAVGTVSLPIARVPGSALRRQVNPRGVPAVTHYETLSIGAGGALLRLRLETGRTHQIRVHMSALGCPLAGDFLYGREDPALIRHTALHAGDLCFRHPFSGETLSFSASPPPEFLRCQALLGITPSPDTFSGSPCLPASDAGPCSPPAPLSR